MGQRIVPAGLGQKDRARKRRYGVQRRHQHPQNLRDVSQFGGNIGGPADRLVGQNRRLLRVQQAVGGIFQQDKDQEDRLRIRMPAK